MALCRTPGIALLVACSGCWLQQTTTVDVRVRAPGEVAVRAEDGAVILPAGAGLGKGEVATTRILLGADGDRADGLPARVFAARDEDGAAAIAWPGVRPPNPLVGPARGLWPGNRGTLAMPSLRAPGLVVPFESAYAGGPCRRGRRSWICEGLQVRGQLATPWANVERVRRTVVPIAHEWGHLDLVVGTVLGLVAASFAAPPHSRRSEGDDLAIAAGLGVPALLALVSGVAIVLREPYRQEWSGGADGPVRRDP